MRQQNTLPGYFGMDTVGSIPTEGKEFLEFLQRHSVGTLNTGDLKKLHPEGIIVRDTEAKTLERKAQEQKTKALSLLQQACVAYSKFLDIELDSKYVFELNRWQTGRRKEKRLVMKNERAYHTVKQAEERRKQKLRHEEKLQENLDRRYGLKAVESMLEEMNMEEQEGELPELENFQCEGLSNFNLHT